MRSLTGVAIAVLIAGWPAGNGHAQSTQTRAPGTFRSNVTMVPLDVRVLDERGRPVTDLQAEDFTILEDGVPQVVRQFARLELTAAHAATGQGLAFKTAAETSTAPQSHRVFVIVLGRGRLQGPSKGLDALIDFVERRLLPQDQLAVLAYNRATDFTTDRRPILEVLSRFKAANDLIESKLEHWYSGPPGNAEDRLPRHVQPLIDDVFAGPHATRFRYIPPGRIADARRLADGFEREAERAADDVGIEAFDSYVSSALATRQDLGSIYTGIEYLRFIDGEKRLIYVSTDGLFLPSVEDDLSLASVASDARVAIDIIQTGGLYADPPGLRSLSERSWRHTWAISAIRNVSDHTGGRAFAYRYADEALEEIDRTTRTGYLLGYVPEDLLQDGAFRRVEVKVARKGARVQHRRGYYARAQLIPHDRRQFMTFSRILSAAAFPDRIDDIRLELEARTSAADSGAEVVLRGTIDSDRIVLDRQGTARTGRLEIALFAIDRRNRLVGERWFSLDLSLDEREHRAVLRDGLPLDARVPVRGEAVTVKAVIYDFAADAVGSVTVRVRR